MDSLSQWLLDHYGKEHFHPGLERIKEAIAPLRQKLSATRIITIAGTNGKGETTLRLSKLLGKRPHYVWTSPHIERITERFRNEQGEIGPRELETLIFSCHEEVLKRKLKLTYYEFLFFVFCTWAAERPSEHLLLEVGLGGRLDAVNAFDASLVLLPSISRDHQEFLGRRYDQILREKLGVLRTNATLISFVHQKYLRERIGAEFIDLESIYPLPVFEFSLRNQFLAYAAYCHLSHKKISPGDFRPDVGFLEHRGERIVQGCEWTFFGSHNIDGLRNLIQISRAANYTSVIMAFSQRTEADLLVMLRMVKASCMRQVKVTAFEHPKAAPHDVMKKLALQEGLEFVEDIRGTIAGFTAQDRVLVTGSYYFLGHFKSILRSEPSALAGR